MTEPMPQSRFAFIGAPLDRADPVRNDPVALAALLPTARFLSLDGLSPHVGSDGRLCWRNDRPAGELVFLGLDGAGQGHFVAVAPALVGSTAPADPGLWDVLALLPPEDVATWGGARSLVDWHARHRFCARCGSATVLAKGGWQRDCTGPGCGAHPVTIMTVEHDGHLLLGRQPRFPAGMYSALAGFVEPGESVEEAVAREVFEEAGVRVRDVSYVASQPWPFPSSLMIACHAQADDPALRIDTAELEDARWFSRAEVRLALARDPAASFAAPLPRAVAHHLLCWWIAQGA